MLSVGVQKEKRGKMPPHQCPRNDFWTFWLSFGCHFEPQGGERGPWTSIWASLCPVSPPSGPQIDFWIILTLILGPLWRPNSRKNNVLFIVFFGTRLRWDSGWFWWYLDDFLGALKILESERGIFQKCLFYIRNRTVFNGCGLHFGYHKSFVGDWSRF